MERPRLDMVGKSPRSTFSFPLLFFSLFFLFFPFDFQISFETRVQAGSGAQGSCTRILWAYIAAPKNRPCTKLGKGFWAAWSGGIWNQDVGPLSGCHRAGYSVKPRLMNLAWFTTWPRAQHHFNSCFNPKAAVGVAAQMLGTACVGSRLFRLVSASLADEGMELDLGLLRSQRFQLLGAMYLYWALIWL